MNETLENKPPVMKFHVLPYVKQYHRAFLRIVDVRSKAILSDRFFNNNKSKYLLARPRMVA